MAATLVAGARGTVAITESLANGTYTVAYRVVSSDGDPVQGSYTFTVADPTAAAAPTTAPTPDTVDPTPATASATPDRTGSNVGIITVGVVLLALLTAGAGLWWWRRPSRR